MCVLVRPEGGCACPVSKRRDRQIVEIVVIDAQNKGIFMVSRLKSVCCPRQRVNSDVAATAGVGVLFKHLVEQWAEKRTV